MNTGRVVQGLILVAIGTILLLNQQGIIDWSVWTYLIQFWPVLLIIWGIQLVFNKSKLSLSLSLLLIIGVLMLAFGLWNGYGYFSGNASVINLEKLPIEPDIEEAKLRLDYGGGRLNISSSRDRELILKYDYPTPKVNSRIKGKVTEYRIDPEDNSWPRFIPNRVGGEWELQLPKGVLWDVDMNVGAIKGDLDFSAIDLNSMELDAGAGDISLRLGDRGLNTKIRVSAAATSIKVFVPETVNLQLSFEGALTDHNLDAAGLVKIGKYYVYTPNSQSSSNLELEFSGAVSRVELVRIPESN